MKLRLYSLLSGFAALAFSAGAAAMTQPTPEQFQAYLHKQIENGRGAIVAPFYPGKTTQQLAGAMLDALWTEKSYQDNMAAWLAVNHADTTEDLVGQWNKHYHQAFGGIYEFLDDDTVSLMWRLSRWNAIYAMKREDCQSKSAQQVGEFIEAANQALLADNWQKLASVLPKALAYEFDRENNPKPGDRPVPEMMSKTALASLRATMKTWPPEDAKRIEDQFSYLSNKERTTQEQCEVSWVVSHAINDSKVENTKEMVSAKLMRNSITQSAYIEAFQHIDAPVGASRPKIPGFTPGKAMIYYPTVVVENNVHGDMSFKIAIDETGKVTDVTLSKNALQPDKATSLDGGIYDSADLLLQVVSTYFRDGTFSPKMVDGKASAQTIELPMHWQLH